MRWIKWAGIIAAIILVTSCFMPWVIIHSISSTITGIDTAGTNFGKPAYFHFITSFFFLLLIVTPKVWAKRANLLVTALNMAWAIRNYFIITMCRAGECPEKKFAIYLIVISSVIMMMAALLPDMKTDRKKSISDNP